MPKRTLFKYSALALSLFFAYSATANEMLPAQLSEQTAAARASIDPPRIFILEQPGKPEIVEKQYRWYDQSPLQSTGFWVERGEAVVINLDYQGSAITPALEFFVDTPDDRTRKFAHAYRQPLRKGENILVSNRSGILYIASFNAPIAGDIKVNIRSGGKPFARFVLGEHSAQDYQQMLRKFDDIPYVELKSNRVLITLRRAAAMKNIGSEGPESALKSWDKIVTLAENQYGLTSENINSPHQRILHRFHWLDGLSLPGVINNDRCGGVLNSTTWRLMACAEGHLGYVVNNKNLAGGNGWGPWHELGHQFQMIPMDWGSSSKPDNMTEVVVNLTSLYVERELGINPRLEKDKHWDEQVFPYLNKSSRDYHNLNSQYAKVAMLWQLDLTFGKDFYARLGKLYREIPKNQQPDDSAQKVQRFILETSRVSGYNLIPFFEKWGLPLTQATRQNVNGLALKKLEVPIWENRDSDVRYDLSQSVEIPLSDTLRNAGAESGDLSAWHLDKGQFRVITTQDGIKAAEGKYFFTARLSDSAAGNDRQDLMSQSIALDKDKVSQGKSSVILTFKSNGWGDGDYGKVTLIARDAQGNTLEAKDLDTKHPRNRWLDNKLVMVLPADSTSLTLQVQATKVSGQISDVHFDNFVLKIEQTDSDKPDNAAPIAKASVNPAILTGAGKITLSASGSYDPDGDALRYKWKQVAGPTVSLNGGNTIQATAQLAAVKQKTLYGFEVTVTDTVGAYDTRTVSMTQQPAAVSSTPAWERSTTYKLPCVKVSYQGKEWLNGWWTQGDLPGAGGTWAVWREVGSSSMHGICK